MAKTKKQAEDVEVRWNPLVKGGRLTQHYPELALHEEFNSATSDDEKIIRFALLIADPKSEVYKMLDFPTRVKEACRLVEIKDTQLIDDLLLSKNMKARRAISKFFTINNNKKMDSWYALTCHFQQMNYILTQPITGVKDILKAMEIKNKIAMSLSEIRKEIQMLERDLFQDADIEGIIRENSLQTTIHYAEMFSDSPETVGYEE